MIVTGTVPDVRPFLAQARVSVAPLRISQGIQNKVLEALAAGAQIRLGLVKHAGCGVDTLDQYQAFVRRYRASQRLRAVRAA